MACKKSFLNFTPWKEPQKKNTNTALKAGIGAALGGLLFGVLLAPKAGKDTRKNLADGAKNASTGAMNSIRNYTKIVQQKLNKSNNAKKDENKDVVAQCNCTPVCYCEPECNCKEEQ